MRFGKFPLAVWFLSSLFTLNLRAQADTIYTNQSQFLSAVQPGYYLESFDSLPSNSSVSSPQTFSGNGFSYTASAPSGLYGVIPDSALLMTMRLQRI